MKMDRILQLAYDQACANYGKWSDELMEHPNNSILQVRVQAAYKELIALGNSIKEFNKWQSCFKQDDMHFKPFLFFQVNFEGSNKNGK